MTPLTSRRTNAAVVCLLLVAVLRSGADNVPSGDICAHPGDNSPSCVCQHPKGRIDLTPLVFKNGSFNEKLINVGPDGNDYLYDYNPCYAFSSTAPCTVTYLCQHKDGSTFFSVGSTGSESIYIDNKEGKVYAYYNAPTADGNLREAWVDLVCDRGATSGKETISTTGDSEVSLLYRFTLRSCYACPGGCFASSSHPSIVGAIGIVIILLLIAAVVSYFIIGAVILKVRYQKTGSDIIPNKGFWFALPVLIKDGIVFTISPCRRFINRNKYEKM